MDWPKYYKSGGGFDHLDGIGATVLFSSCGIELSFMLCYWDHTISTLPKKCLNLSIHVLNSFADQLKECQRQLREAEAEQLLAATAVSDANHRIESLQLQLEAARANERLLECELVAQRMSFESQVFCV
jgi:hypothetical protein